MSSPPPPPPPPTTTPSPTLDPSPPPPPTTASPPPVTAAPPPPQPRKFPAPCWTQEETLALITTYKEKWYSLRRRNLRTADWESVAADVFHRCPPSSASPLRKTSAQCRHKMEKLRKRYRTEKQRAATLSLQNRFLSPPPSSWVFFDLMDSMESGSDTPSTHNNSQIAPPHPGSLYLRPVNGGGADVKPDKDQFSKYFDEILMGRGSGGSGNGNGNGNGSSNGGVVVPIKFKVKNHSYDHVEDDEVEDDRADYGRRNPMPGPPPGFKRMYSGQDDYGERKSLDNGVGVGVGVGSGSRGGGGRDSVGEMVASIKMLGEGLVRMEKMKMDMMREIEKMRMEMEMKRSEMILESQQLIVNAFVQGFKKNKKPKVMEVE